MTGGTDTTATRAPYGLDFHLGLPEALEPRHVPIRPGVPTPEQAAAAEAADRS
ncbi:MULTISPECIES: hypothetical protein [Streptomyces]|uniref:Uncharacterized protein n=2 Tax=Streptomyces TaxID=1883 RepID=A0ABU2RIQ4_9ACTN|nr:MULTISPECIES: hypothetical protein [unclassified Streptomyces]MDT0428372.1 hypothetical protein [Streptomyces sp. DSM 41770]